MALSVNLIQTRQDCDTILTELTTLEDTLSFNQLRIQRAKDAALKRASALDADLAAAQAEIDSLTAVIAALPDGPTKTEMNNRKRKAENSLFTLQLRKEQFGTTAVILYESDLLEIAGRLTVVAASQSEILAHMNTLPA